MTLPVLFQVSVGGTTLNVTGYVDGNAVYVCMSRGRRSLGNGSAVVIHLFIA